MSHQLVQGAAAVNNMYGLFAQSMSPDIQTREHAEKQLKQLANVDGFLSTLLQIIVAPESDASVRQAAAIYFKNQINHRWGRDMSDGDIIGPHDATFVKQNILQAIIQSPHIIRLQLSTCLASILGVDYPEKWSDYLTNVHSMLKSTVRETMLGGLICLQELVKVYQWKTAEKRGPLNTIIKTTFPTLLQMSSPLLNQDSLEGAELLKLILKVYHMAMQHILPKPLQDMANLVHWATLFVNTIQKDLSNIPMPDDLEAREKHSWWKCKKWAYHCLYRLLSKHGNPNISAPGGDKNEKSHAVFAKMFMENFAGEIVRAYLQQLERCMSGVWTTNRAKQQLALFFCECVKHKTTWQLIKPHLEPMVVSFIFPLLCFSDEDQEIWAENPVEYIHKKVDPMEEFRSPVFTAEHLLFAIVKDRFKHTFLPVMTFVNNILVQYNALSPNQRNPRIKDGALSMVARLADQILSKKSSLRSQMEDFLVREVYPEFTSPIHYLRARACDVLRVFSELEFQNEQNLHIAFQHLLNCLHDPELPVRVEAALCLNSFFRHDSIQEAMKPHAQNIMQVLLHLTNEIDMDTLTEVMETLVQEFATELTPFAVQLTVQLRDTFLRIIGEVYNNTDEPEMDDSDVDKTMAAMGVLKTMSSLVLAVESSQEIMAELELTCIPVIQYVLEKNVIDLYEEVFEIIDTCTFCSKRISPAMWSIFALIYKAFKEDASDHIEDMLPSLDNYLTYGSLVISETPQYQNMIYDIAQTSVQSDTPSEKLRGCQVVEAMLLNLQHGIMDAYIPKFMALALEHLKTPDALDSLALRVHIIEIVLHCMYYNLQITLQCLEQVSFTVPFFTFWFNHLDDFLRVQDKKICILALCAVLNAYPNMVPVQLQPNVSGLLYGIVKCFETYPEALKRRKEMEQAYETGSDDEEIEDDDEATNGSTSKDLNSDRHTAEIDDDDVRDEDDEYLEFLAERAAHGFESYEDEDEDMSEDVYYFSPLDSVDPYTEFHRWATTCPAAVQLVSTLPAEAQAKIQKVVQDCVDEIQKRANEEANKQQEAAQNGVAGASLK
ncbi:hypothetical protein SeMB42_g02690 [Synchytrium endobioticum]|uniref:Importin N-terminal domain-containing protein n=1 Tax=Synchytrium endobioticum TaxID=286115 RepID=A0A507D6H6_9FUNG|nr:hypothetical protein SeLEV6574_g02981 [Synchytrium endobioticum]TPX49232.1 hypothetical protein SeMB42_g02690 [Synchytrium endobioticum]